MNSWDNFPVAEPPSGEANPWDQYPAAEKAKNPWDAFPVAEEASPPKERPFFRLSDVGSALGDVLGGVAQTPASIRAGLAGLKNPRLYTPEEVAANAERAKFNQDVAQRQAELEEKGESSTVGNAFRGAAQSVPFTLSNMAAMGTADLAGRAIGAGVGALAGPEAIPAGSQTGALAARALRFGASGTAGYYAAKASAGQQFLNDTLGEIKTRFKQQTGKEMSEAEQDEAYKEVLPLAEEYGKAEAGPETVGNLAQLWGGKYLLGLGKHAVEGIAKRVGAFALGQTAEHGGETYTGSEQHNLEERKNALIEGRDVKPENLRTGLPGYAESFKEEAPTTLALSALGLGAGTAYKGIKAAVTPAAPQQAIAADGTPAPVNLQTPVEVNGQTVAYIPQGSDLTPEDVADFAAEPDTLKSLARAGKITLPEIVTPVPGVDPAITAEMNDNVAAGAALAPGTVEALKASQAATAEVSNQGIPDEQAERNVAKQRQQALDNLKQVSPVTTANENPADAANVSGDSQSVQTEPAEGSIPAVTADTVPTQGETSTAEIQPTQDHATGTKTIEEGVRAEPAPGDQSREIESPESRDSVLRAEEERRQEVTPLEQLRADNTADGIAWPEAVYAAAQAFYATGEVTGLNKIQLARAKRALSPSAEAENNARREKVKEQAAQDKAAGMTIGEPVAFTAPNGQKIIGTVQSVTGTNAVVSFPWNGKTINQALPVSRLSRPVTALSEAPRYIYTQEQNSRKAGKHIPVTPGVHENFNFRQAFASMAEDKSLSRIYQEIARILSKMPQFANMDLHIVADGRRPYAGEYTHNNGRSAIAINLRQVARGKVDALGTLLHEALHHLTIAKVLHSQGDVELEAVHALNEIRLKLAKLPGAQKFAYELGSNEEFITGVFTHPGFQDFLASTPSDFSPATHAGKFRSVLSEVFRRIAELATGKHVPPGSTLDHSMASILALFETPHRNHQFGPLQRLSAESKAEGYHSPADLLAETAAKMRGEKSEKPAGLNSMFNPQSKRPTTGERTLFQMPGKPATQTPKEWALTLPDATPKTAARVDEMGTKGRALTTDFQQGKLTADHYGDDPYIYRDEYINPNNFRNDLKLEGLTYEQVAKMPSTQQYIEWYREGHLPPPVNVVVRQEDGSHFVTDRRRMVAAIEAGINRIPARVEIGRASELKEKLSTKPIDLTTAYQKAHKPGSSTAWVTIKDVYEQAHQADPALTPEAFMAHINEQNDAGGIMVSPVENVKTVEAAGPFVVGGAGVEMLVPPQGTAASVAESHITPEQDAEYMRAVKDGDVAKQQSMVDDAAASPFNLVTWDADQDLYTDETASDMLEKVFTESGLEYDSRGKKPGFILFDNDKIIGGTFNNKGRMSSYTFDVAVLPEFQKRNLGKLLIDLEFRQAASLAEDGGIDTIFLKAVNRSLARTLKKQYDWKEYGIGFDGDSLELDVSNGFNPVETFPAITRDAEGNVIPLSQRFNPENNSILYAAPINLSQPSPDDRRTASTEEGTAPLDEVSKADGLRISAAMPGGTPVTPASSGSDPVSVLARLGSAREKAVSAAVAENDWGNYTSEQKIEALNSFIRSVYRAADDSLRDAFRGIGGILYARGTRRSASATGAVEADGRLHLTLTYDNSAGTEDGVRGGASARDMFTHAYDTAQEEIIHAADKVAAFRRWEAAGRPGTLNTFERAEGLQVLDQLNKARLDLQESNPAAAQKIKDAMLASWGVYYGKPVEGVSGLVRHLENANNAGLYFYELRRQLTQLKRQDFTTETGWQKFQRVLKQWITDAINSLRGVQDIFRSGMAGDLIQKQLADLEAALDGKPLPPGPVLSQIDEDGAIPPTIDIGGEAEPADGKGKQLHQKKPTAIGKTYTTPADITLQEKRTQEETLAKARTIIGESVAADGPIKGRRAALDRFRLDTSIPPEVRAAGTGVIAQQSDILANLEEAGPQQLLLDEMTDEAAKLSGVIASDPDSFQNLKADANLNIDKMAEEAGRTLNIFNVFRRLTPEGFLRRMTRKYNDAVREKVGQNFDVPVEKVESEIALLRRLARESTSPERRKAILAAIKAFQPHDINAKKLIEELFPQAGFRARMNKGGESLVRDFFQMTAGPRDGKGPLAEFDETIQGALSSMLRKVMEAQGLVAKNASNQMTDIDKMVRVVSGDELRFDKIAAADDAMQQELAKIQDPERRATLQQAWEEATSKMFTNIASDATVRRAINAELKSANVDWTKMFNANQQPTAIRGKVVDAVMGQIEKLLTDPTNPTVQRNLGMLRDEVAKAFDFISDVKHHQWLAQREAVEARRRVAEHRAAFMAALRNQGVAEQAIERISEKLAGPQRGKPDQNPVSALVGEHMREEVPGFVDKLVDLDVDRDTAEKLDKAANALRKDIAAAEKLKAADRAVAALMKSLKPKPRAPREKIERSLKTLLTADTVGALDDQAFFDAFGEAFGMPPLSSEQQAKIKKLIREVNALPKGPARLDAQQALDEELGLWKGIAARDVLLSAWYANILSGVSTQGMGVFGNSINLLLRSAFNALGNPRSAAAYFKGAFGEGLATGIEEAKAAMKGKGLYKVSKYGDKNLISALELLRKKGPSTLPEWVAYIASGGTRLRYVFRIMQAIDALAWNTAREGHAYLAAHRALLDQEKQTGQKRSPEEFYRAFVDSLGGDTAQIEEDLRAARQTLIDAGQTPALLTVDRMARETRNARRAAAGVKGAIRFADRIVLQQDPEGSGKFISSLIDVFQKKGNILGIPFGQLLIPFNKIVSNLFEQSLDYTPVGVLRAYLGGHLSDVKGLNGKGHVEFKEGTTQFDPMERRERAMVAVAGMAAAAIIYALAHAHKDEPDEDVPFMVYGWGPESKTKRAQMPKGWVPYSVKIGDHYVKFSEMPFGMLFAAAGTAMDSMRYKNMDKKTASERLAYVLKSSAKGFMNQGVMSSLDTAMETMMFQASDKKMADIPVNAVKGLVPAQGLLRDITTIMDPNKVSNDSLTSALLRDIPFAKAWGTKPELNVFGEPIKQDGYPILRRLTTHREPHAVADYLGRNDLHIPGMEQTIEIGKYLPKAAHDRIQTRAVELGAMENGLFTPEQNYKFKQRAGELTKAAVQDIMKDIPKIANEVQRKHVQSVIDKRVENARKRAMLEAVPIK